MSNLIIIRGLPGSGKTTLAQHLVKTEIEAGLSCWTRVEADMYFVEDGVYKFDPSKIRDAHAWCQKTVKSLLASGQNVIVSNTFTTMKEVQFYLDLVSKDDLMIIHCDDQNFGSIHNVPAETIEKMKARFEPVEGEYLTSTYRNTGSW